MFFRLIIVFFIFQIFVPQKAFAYLDPGTGSMILQIIIASILGIGITFKGWILKLKNIFRKEKND